MAFNQCEKLCPPTPQRGGLSGVGLRFLRPDGYFTRLYGRIQAELDDRIQGGSRRGGVGLGGVGQPDSGRWPAGLGGIQAELGGWIQDDDRRDWAGLGGRIQGGGRRWRLLWKAMARLFFWGVAAGFSVGDGWSCGVAAGFPVGDGLSLGGWRLASLWAMACLLVGDGKSAKTVAQRLW